ncbi:MAG: hypothetical protein JRI23_18435 [Deltaproteobacteria bacterium]|jgi:hypothetical protein|nr:hypothetical protein [Deltaproteobacteria bacterium]MBW2533836.1 hypothetical protein [Deltaproteobacteria bacterium]
MFEASHVSTPAREDRPKKDELPPEPGSSPRLAETIRSLSPATGELLGEVPVLSAREVPGPLL